MQFCREPLLYAYSYTKQFHLCEFSRGRRTVKRNEMHLCATVSLLFCVLPKVVISHGRKDRSSRSDERADANPRSLTRETKCQMWAIETVFILSKPLLDPGPFRGSRARESIYRREYLHALTLINIGASARISGGILVLAHVWLLVKKFRCELREELVIRETRAGFLRARNPDRRCRVVAPADEKSSLLSRSRDFLTGWTLSRRAPTYTHLRTSGCEIPVDARRKRIRPTVIARACASVRISVSPACTQVSRHARNVIIVGHRDEGNVSETHESANLCRDEWQP